MIRAKGGASAIVFVFGVLFPVGLAILVSSFLIFPLVERATNAKQVQQMAGVHSGKTNACTNYFYF